MKTAVKPFHSIVSSDFSTPHRGSSRPRNLENILNGRFFIGASLNDFQLNLVDGTTFVEEFGRIRRMEARTSSENLLFAAELFRENSAAYVDRNGPELPVGSRCIWEDRGKLCVGKLADRITPSTKEDLEGGLSEYDAVQKDHPNDVVARTGRAEVLKSMGDLEGALAEYYSVLKDHTNNVVTRNGRAVVLSILRFLIQSA